MTQTGDKLHPTYPLESQSFQVRHTPPPEKGARDASSAGRRLEPRSRQALQPSTATEECGYSVRLKPDECSRVRVEQRTDLFSHRFEHGSGFCPAGDEGRHPPQRSLLLRDPAQLFPRLGAFHGGRDEFGKPRNL